MTEKLSSRVERLEGPDRSVDRVIKQAIGHEWDYSADWDYWDALKQEKASQPVAKPYTASLDAAMSLVPRERVADVMSAAWKSLANKYGLHCNHWPDGHSFQQEFAQAVVAHELKARGL